MSLHLPFRTFCTAGKLVMLVAVLLLGNCKGKDGEIGPAGPAGADGHTGAAGPQGVQGDQGPEGKSASQGFENGFIKGTIKGIRRDGQLFMENFEFKLADRRENFTEPGQLLSSGITRHNLNIYRFNSLEELTREENDAAIQLLIENKGQTSQHISIADFKVDFVKLLTDQDLFVFQTYANFNPDEETVLPISRSNNIAYGLADYGRSSRYIYDNAAAHSYIEFIGTNGNKIYFEPQEENDEFYKFAFTINAAGEKTTHADLYQNLLVKANYLDEFTFYDNSYQDLSETIVVPADAQEISNFEYDAATGMVTFDYKVVVHEFRNENTSRHQVEISGSVRANVYNNILMREAAE
jgi:hypothetical protein